MAASLEKLDPAEAWKPATEDIWNLKWAAHLFRRAGFGAPPFGFFVSRTSWEALQHAEKFGMDECVNQVIDGGPGQDYFTTLADEDTARLMNDDTKLPQLQGWWLNRMLFTPHPLVERMTLFWHNHFATSIAKITKPALMLQQNMLFRKYALGDFRELLREMGRNPAMLIWLDAASNVKGTPNENYAREVMELFSLGVGNYTEQDIREAARAFTGWRASGRGYEFSKGKHDDTVKTVLGQTGRWGADDVARILLEQPVAARFLVRKLFREFVNELEPPPERLIDPLAEQLRESNYDIKQCMRTMLRSRLFYSEAAYRKRIKSPVEYVVGLLNAFYAVVPAEAVAESMDGLGQSLFAPPNVKGWDGGKIWLNSSTLLGRHNLAWRLVGGEDVRFSRRIDPHAFVRTSKKDSADEQVDFLLNVLLQGDVDKVAREKLVNFLQDGSGEEREQESRLRELTHTILLMPSYQLA